MWNGIQTMNWIDKRMWFFFSSVRSLTQRLSYSRQTWQMKIWPSCKGENGDEKPRQTLWTVSHFPRTNLVCPGHLGFPCLILKVDHFAPEIPFGLLYSRNLGCSFPHTSCFASLIFTLTLLRHCEMESGIMCTILYRIFENTYTEKMKRSTSWT